MWSPYRPELILLARSLYDHDVRITHIGSVGNTTLASHSTYCLPTG